MLSSILVSLVILNGIGLSGFTNVLNVSTICLFSTFTAPISIIWLLFAPKPVVSKSNTTNESLKFCPLSFFTVPIRSSTRYASTPYSILRLSSGFKQWSASGNA